MKYEIVREITYNDKGKKEKGDYFIRYEKSILGFKWYNFITDRRMDMSGINVKVKTSFKSYNRAEKYIKKVLNTNKTPKKIEYIVAGEVDNSTKK